MRDLETLTYHPMSERIVDVLRKKTQNDNPEFFRILLSYHLAKVAATMRVTILTRDRGEIPVNLYAINLASSGHGKGHSTNIIEEQLLDKFKQRFLSETYPGIVEESLHQIALNRAYIDDEEEDTVLQMVKKEFAELGELAFSFDSGTPAAIKQLRHKLIMGGAGAINLEIDEIGSNLLGNGEALNAFLEMFDVGLIKQKITKNTKENTRNKEMFGRTPANLLMFGTPAKLFDGAKTEDELVTFLETGYARRCIFGMSTGAHRNVDMTSQEIFDALTDTSVSQFLQDTAISLAELADITNHNKIITVSEAVSITIIDYKRHCEDLSDKMGDHQEILRAEMAHRYFKALKIAGTYAFIDGHDEVTKDNFYHAVCLVEESGRAFEKIMARDRNYVKLAKYLGQIPHEVTHVDLAEDLVFFKGTVSAKQEMIHMASAWGFKNQIAITKTMTGGIEFLQGSMLEETDLTQMRLSFSGDIADGYENANAPWDALHKLTQEPYLHWINHHSRDGHRHEENLVKGFNMVVLDIDGGATLQEVQLFLEEYKFMVYTTKRHTPQTHRFRLLMPMNYILELTADDYTDFMKNIFEWIPFGVDAQTCQRSRKWLTCTSNYQYNDGEKLLDARMFMPKTTRNDERKSFVATYQSMTNMERWFLTHSGGNRNNQLSRYAFLMVDLGYPIENIRDCVIELNAKLPDKLKEAEIDRTIMVTTAKKIARLAQP